MEFNLIIVPALILSKDILMIVMSVNRWRIRQKWTFLAKFFPVADFCQNSQFSILI